MISKRKVRCYKTLAQVAANIYKYPVYVLFYEGWSNFSFVTCTNCAELFVIDWANPKTGGLIIKDIAKSDKCPTCSSFLKDTLQNYPKTIKLPNGELGSFTTENFIPSDSETLIIEFFEIVPSV